jgi:Zinc finger, C2H2 type
MSLRSHIKRHFCTEVRAKYPCSFCDKMLLGKGNVAAHERIYHPADGVRKEHNCHCGRTFSTQGGLFQHVKTAHEKVRFPCSKCDKICTSKATLGQHDNSHHKPKQPCEICGALVSPGSDYLTHVRNHSTWFKCKFPECGKEFRKIFSIRYHYDTVHTPAKNVSCSICNATFTAEMKLQSHIRKQHEIEPVNCIFPDCSFTTLRKPFLALHYEKRHMEVDGDWRVKFNQHLQEVKFVKKESCRVKKNNLEPSEVAEIGVETLQADK